MFTISEIAERIKTQDNLCTEAPIFAVQQRKRIYGMDPDYTDAAIWIHCDGDEAEPGEAFKLSEKQQRGEKIPDEWTLTGYFDEWEFVTACFTREACQRYIDENGHNLHDPRIYAYGSYRNKEWGAVRDYLTADAHAVEEELANRKDEYRRFHEDRAKFDRRIERLAIHLCLPAGDEPLSEEVIAKLESQQGVEEERDRLRGEVKGMREALEMIASVEDCGCGVPCDCHSWWSLVVIAQKALGKEQP